MDKSQPLEKRVRNKVLTTTLIGIPTFALIVTGTLYYIEKDRKEENIKKIKSPAIVQPITPDYSPQMSDIYTPDIVSQDVGYIK